MLCRLVILAVILWLAISLSLFGQIVARVGNSEITAGQLSQEIAYISEDSRYEALGYLERREIALENLITEQLIYLYALENRIEVTEDEVEQYFIAQFGDLPRFSTNGYFDHEKFRDIKHTPEVQRILNELHRELLIIKTKTILKNSFTYSDNQLYERYIMENTDLDISYAVINQDDVNLPFFIHPLEAYDYYWNNRKRYPVPEYSKVEFFIVPFQKYYDMITISEDEIDQYFQEIDQVPDALRGETEELVRREKVDRYTLEEAERTRNNLINGLPVDIRLMETKVFSSDFAELNRESIFTRYNLVSDLERRELQNYSEPFETEIGYLVYRVIARDRINNPLTYHIARNVWQDFVRDRISREFQEIYEAYYRTNLNDFIVPALHITRFTLNRPEMVRRMRINDRMLRNYYENNRHLFSEEEQEIPFHELRDRVEDKYIESEMEKQREWAAENIYLVGYDMLPTESRDLPNGINLKNEVVFLELVPNKDIISELIKDQLLKEQHYKSGNLETEEEIVYYRINSFFPTYMPRYEDVEEILVRELGIDRDETEIDYREYYTRHRNLFTAPDSIRVSGVFVPIVTDTLTVDEEGLHHYYLTNRERFYSEPEVIFEYIYIKDRAVQEREFVKQIDHWLDNQISFSTIQYCFGTELEYPQNRPVLLSNLSPHLYEMLQNLTPGQRGEPFYYDDGWYIVRKIRDIEPSMLSYDEIRDELWREMLQQKADAHAYETARQFFVELNSVRDLNTFADSLLVFTTEKSAIDGDFGPLGEIDAYAPRILNLRRNEKLNTLYRNDDGYGIVFLLEKDVDQIYSFEDALPMISRLISEEQKESNAQNCIRQLRELVIAETDPDSLLVFFGGWKRETNLTLDSYIPQIRYSKQIIEDAVNREVGEVSHVMKISDDEYTFYRVDRKQRVGRDTFQFVRDDYRSYIAELEFKEWLSEYRDRKVVEKY